MVQKAGNLLRNIFDGFIITFVCLFLNASEEMGGTELNGFICVFIWAILIGFMARFSNFGAVIGSFIIYFIVYIVKFGFTESIGVGIFAVVIILVAAYISKARK